MAVGASARSALNRFDSFENRASAEAPWRQATLKGVDREDPTMKSGNFKVDFGALMAHLEPSRRQNRTPGGILILIVFDGSSGAHL